MDSRFGLNGPRLISQLDPNTVARGDSAPSVFDPTPSQRLHSGCAHRLSRLQQTAVGVLTEQLLQTPRGLTPLPSLPSLPFLPSLPSLPSLLGRSGGSCRGSGSGRRRVDALRQCSQSVPQRSRLEVHARPAEVPKLRKLRIQACSSP